MSDATPTAKSMSKAIRSACEASLAAGASGRHGDQNGSFVALPSEPWSTGFELRCSAQKTRHGVSRYVSVRRVSDGREVWTGVRSGGWLDGCVAVLVAHGGFEAVLRGGGDTSRAAIRLANRKVA